MTEPSLPALRGEISHLPKLVEACGAAATYAFDEFVYAVISNPHTRRAYLRAVGRFLKWAEARGLSLPEISAGTVGRYLAELKLAPPSKKVELAALRHFFDCLTLRHVVAFNPAASVRGERFSAEGSTPEIAPDQSRKLLDSIPEAGVVNLRDRAILATCMFTGARDGAVAGLTRGSLMNNGLEYRLRFKEKNGKRRDIPCRNDLAGILLAYLEAAGLMNAEPDSPFFRSAKARGDTLFDRGISGGDVWRIMKRRLTIAGLSSDFSPHSFRVSVATDLLNQKTPLEDVQTLLGHSDPRTTRIYDRTHRQVTRKLVERISA